MAPFVQHLLAFNLFLSCLLSLYFCTHIILCLFLYSRSAGVQQRQIRLGGSGLYGHLSKDDAPGIPMFVYFTLLNTSPTFMPFL